MAAPEIPTEDLSTTNWAYNSVVEYSVDGTSWTEILHVKDFDDQKLKRKKIDTTHLRSPLNTAQARAGMVENEAIKLQVAYAKDQHAALLAMAVANDPNRYWRFTLSEGSFAKFIGYVAEFPIIPKATNDDIYYTDMSIQPTGVVTFEAAS